MRADLSRNTFNARKHYAAVLHQQGRVWLDADWNEDVLDRMDVLQKETFDVVGPCGCPDPHAAFGIAPTGGGAPGDLFTIGGGPGAQGRYYVQGVMVQLDQACTYLTQPDYPDPPAIPVPMDGGSLNAVVYLETWQRYISYLEDEDIREKALLGPDTAGRIKTIAQVKVWPLSPGVAPACGMLPPAGQGNLTTVQPADTPPTDPCRIPDPATYTGRENHFYRVEIHEPGDVVDATPGSTRIFSGALASDAAVGDTKLTLATALSSDQTNALTASGVATLTDMAGNFATLAVSAVSGATVTLGTALVTAFQAVNSTFASGTARFKWSADNASFSVGVSAYDASRLQLTVTSLGRDQATALRSGDIVEICDDASELGPARGHLTTLISNPQPDTLTLTIADPLPARFNIPLLVQRHMTVRRWDGVGFANATFDAQATPDMDFGFGVHVNFGGSDLRSGDYWQFAARASDGSVEVLTAAPPMGISRLQCPLALVSFGSDAKTGNPAMTFLGDCRALFEPLTKLQACQCDCTVSVAPGESIADAIAKIGPAGGVVCLLEGTHTLTSTVVVPSVNNLTIRGAGEATLVDAAGIDSAFQFLACDHLTLQDFVVQAGNASSTLSPTNPGSVIELGQCELVSMTRCKVRCFADANGQVPRACVYAYAGVGPVIDSISPSSGPAAGGTMVTINGLGFTGMTGVTFGGVAATSFQFVTDILATATSPAGSSGNLVDITVTTPVGTSAPVTADQFTYTNGGLAGINFVANIARRFAPSRAVVEVRRPVATLSDIHARLTDYVAKSTDLTSFSQALLTGLRRHETPSAAPPPPPPNPLTVTSIIPNFGPPSGGTPVLIFGTGFTDLSSVSFGAVPASSFSVLDDSVVSAVSPPGAFGQQVDLTATNAGGPSPISSADTFTYGRRCVDLAVRDCSLLAETGQFALAANGPFGVSIDDSTIASLPVAAYIGADDATQASFDPAKRALTGVGLFNVTLFNMTNTLIAGFFVGCFCSPDPIIQATHSIRAVACGLCGASCFISTAGDLLVRDCLFDADGSAAFLVGGFSVDLSANVIHCLTIGEVGAVAGVSGAVAGLQGNTFRLDGTATPNISVLVRGLTITYAGNRSFCSTLPLKTNICLIAGNQADPGSVVAVGNTCLEPPTKLSERFPAEMLDVTQKAQQLAGAYLGGKDYSTLVGGAANIDKQANGLQSGVTEADQVSLLAVAGNVETSSNLTTYSLVQIGRGNGVGNLNGVF